MSTSPSFVADPPPVDAQPPVDTDLTAASLKRLLHIALPDKSRRKAQGWFGDTDFLLTRAHVDEDGDTYHDGLFLTVWQQWDFWIADAQRPVHASLLQAAASRVGTWLRRQSPAPVGFTQLYRPHGGGASSAWLPFDLADNDGPPEVLQACRQAWHELLGYWRKGVAQRRAHYPLRQQLLRHWPAERIEALALLPMFAQPAPGAPSSTQRGGWQGTLRVSSRPPVSNHGGRHAQAGGAALRLGWRRHSPAISNDLQNDEGEGEGEDDDNGDTVACYQIDVERDASRAGEPALHITYAQRLGDTREPLPAEAADHFDRLLRLLDEAERHLVQTYPAPDNATGAGGVQELAVWLNAAAAHPPHAADEDVIPGHWMALSHTWQAAGRAQAAWLRRHAEQAAADAPPAAPADPRGLHAGRVLQLASEITRRGDPGMAARFHRRFAFAPNCYANRAAASGQQVGPVIWLPEGALAARIGGAGGRWVHVEADGLRCWPLAPEHVAGHSEALASACIEGLTVDGDAEGVLWGRDDDGRVLWHHPVATSAVTGVALSGNGRVLAVGSAGGDLVVLRKAGGVDPFAAGTSRYVEGWRVLFWETEQRLIRW